MHYRFRSFAIGILFFAFMAAVAAGQGAKKPMANDGPGSGNSRATAAYAEVALRRAEMEADLESLLLDYTDDFPRVKELKFALGRMKAESDRLTAIPATEKEKATTALGRLVVRKIDLEIELWKLQQNYAEGHPNVKRARKRVEVFENAIKEILG